MLLLQNKNQKLIIAIYLRITYTIYLKLVSRVPKLRNSQITAT